VTERRIHQRILTALADNIDRVATFLCLLPAVFTIVFVGLHWRVQSAIEEDTRAFLDDLKLGQNEAAYLLLSSRQHATTTLATFESVVRNRPELRGWQTLHCPRIIRFGDSTARLSCVLVHGDGPRALTVGSERESNGWRVDALRFAGEEAVLGSVSY